jgi:ADP-ribosylglycohydrolase
MIYKFENIKSCFLGLAIGDALGVPVEFHDRSFFETRAVKDMLGYGTWQQPVGTWSDDSSLTFCLAESLVSGYDVDDIAKKFVAWYSTGYWGAHCKLFDIGMTTRAALTRIQNGESPKFSGDLDVDSNGNGSLMRMIPASLYFCDLNDAELYEKIREVSSITHGHFRSVFSCFIFSKYAIELFKGKDKIQALFNVGIDIKKFADASGLNPIEVNRFKRVLDGSIKDATEDSIRGSGYVLHCLEASIWCFLKTDSYADAVLKAVNLGEDTDTTGCVTGALAGLYYGEESIPMLWSIKVAREKDIIILAEDFTESLKKKILDGN